MVNLDFSVCCRKGKVSLPSPVTPPDELRNLLVDQTPGEFCFMLWFELVIMELIWMLALSWEGFQKQSSYVQ